MSGAPDLSAAANPAPGTSPSISRSIPVVAISLVLAPIPCPPGYELPSSPRVSALRPDMAPMPRMNPPMAIQGERARTFGIGSRATAANTTPLAAC